VFTNKSKTTAKSPKHDDYVVQSISRVLGANFAI
jgi:hypothetical protein